MTGEIDDPPVPRPLAIIGAWSWRLLLGGAVLWAAALVLARLSVIAVPILVALFVASILEQPVDWLRRHGVPSLAGAWLVFVTALAAVAGAIYWVSSSLTGQFHEVGQQAVGGLDEIERWLMQGPLHLSRRRLDQLTDQVTSAVRLGRRGLLDDIVGQVRTAGRIGAAVILTIFNVFFFLKDGRRIGAWVLERTPAPYREDVSVVASNTRLVMRQYLFGTTVTGLIDGTLIGVALAVIGVPLVLPLAVLTFAGAYLPLVGAFAAGTLAALVALVTKGLTAALIVVAATILVQQIEGHLLQPLVLGRAVHLHPLVTAWSVGAGLLVAGVPGGFLAVPLTATATRVVHFYRCRSGPTAADRSAAEGSTGRRSA